MRNEEKRLLLLGLLRIQKMHGYQLQQFFDEHAGSLPSLKASTAYYTLEKMAGEGLVEATSEREGNRPVRQVYCITERGDALFTRLLEENLAGYENESDSDDIGVAFLSALPPERSRELLLTKRRRIEARLEEVSGVLSSLPSMEAVHLPLNRSRLRIGADLQWIDMVLGFLPHVHGGGETPTQLSRHGSSGTIGLQ
ncbi:MAG TPA: PadR family transcriptional regulator [Spirochaetia bacterium]|nr:PadR family transcriptional regulator [Spirochaetia bacterium]